MGDLRHTLRLVAVLIGLVTALVVIAPATAKAPPKHRYECTIGGIYAGTVTIKSATTYKRFGKTGKYVAGKKKRTYGRAPYQYKGYAIKFRTGPFRGFKGQWHRSNGGINEIALRNPLNGFEDTYCDD